MTLLTLRDKHIVKSEVTVSTTSSSWVDDTEAIIDLNLDSEAVVLVVYVAFATREAEIISAGGDVGIEIDGSVVVSSGFSNATSGTYLTYGGDIFWIGTLSAGSHTIKGKIRGGLDAYGIHIDRRMLLVLVFDGDEYVFINDDTEFQTTSTTPVDDPYAVATFTPSSDCNILVLYHAGVRVQEIDTASDDRYIGIYRNVWEGASQIGGDIAGKGFWHCYTTDYPNSATMSFVTSGVSGGLESEVRGRVWAAGVRTDYPAIVGHRQLAVLLLDPNSTKVRISYDDTVISTTSAVPVDDSYVSITETVDEQAVVVAFVAAVKSYGTSSNDIGEKYGIDIVSDQLVGNATMEEYYCDYYGNCVCVANAVVVSAGDVTVKGVYAAITDGETAKFTERRLDVVFFSIPAAGGGQEYTQELTDSFTLGDTRVLSAMRVISDATSLIDMYLSSASITRFDSVSVSDVVAKSVSKPVLDSAQLSDTKNLSVTKSLADSSSLSDVILSLPAKILQDTISLVEVVVKHGKSVIDAAITLIDSCLLPHLLELLDSLNLSDTITSISARIFQEIISLASIVGKSGSRFFTELMRTADATFKRVTLRKLVEYTSLTDLHVAGAVKLLTDVASLVDLGLKRIAAKCIVVASSIFDVVIKGVHHSMTESIGLSDAVQALRGVVEYLAVALSLLSHKLGLSMFLKKLKLRRRSEVIE